MADSGQKTEKATGKKRRDERRKGNVFSSKDISNVVSLIVVFGFFYIYKSVMYAKVKQFFETYIHYAGTWEDITVDQIMGILMDSIVLFCITVLPLLLLAAVSTVIAIGMQTKFLFAHEALKPKFNRLNPIQGFLKLFSLRSAVEVVKGLLKISIIGAVVYKYVESKIAGFAKTPFLELEQTIKYLTDSVFGLVFSICIFFIFVAALDYIYQRWDYERQIKMTKHEVKEEYKEMEGDPQIKGRIKNTQRKFALSRMMQAVPTADVIIKNPTHYAVALRYNMEKDAAPVVVAKGQDHLALRILEVGEEAGVYITENKVLARALYVSVELNREIPMEYYNVVAEILALIYRTKNQEI